MRIYRILCSFLAFLCLINTAIDGATSVKAHNKQAFRLVNHLLTGYSTNVRPVLNHTEQINVKIRLIYSQLIDMNENEESLTQLIWLRREWQDDYLTWNPDEYDGIEEIHIGAERIWTPDLAVFNELYRSDDKEGAMLRRFPAVVHYSGIVNWPIAQLLTTSCQLAISQYPWDLQVCPLTFGLMMIPATEVNLTNLGVSFSEYTPKAEWNLLGITAEFHEVIYPCCPGALPDITYYIHIRRSVFSILCFVIGPCCLVTLLALLGFYLPRNAMEKVSLNIGVITSIVFYLLAAIEDIPAKGDAVPILSIYFAASIIVMTCSTIATFLVLKYNFQGPLEGRLPAWVYRVFFKWLPIILCQKTEVALFLAYSEHITTQQTDVDIHEAGWSVDLGLASRQRHTCYIVPPERPAWEGSFKTTPRPPMADPCKRTKDTDIGQEASVDSPLETPLAKSMLGKISVSLRKFQQKKTMKTNESLLRSEWEMVAALLDRLFLHVFAIIFCLLTISLFIKPALDATSADAQPLKGSFVYPYPPQVQT